MSPVQNSKGISGNAPAREILRDQKNLRERVRCMQVVIYRGVRVSGVIQRGLRTAGSARVCQQV